MHPQRVMLLPPAVLGMLVQILSLLAILAWITPSFNPGDAVPLEDEAYKRVQWFGTILNWTSLAGFALAGLLIVLGRRAYPLCRFRRLFVSLSALVPLACGTLVAAVYTETFRQFAYEAKVYWPGATTWLTLAAAIVLILTNLLAGRAVKLIPREQADEPTDQPSATSAS